MSDLITYSIQGAQQATGLPRTTLYELISQRKIETRKLGRRTLIVADSLRRYLAALPAADIKGVSGRVEMVA